MLHAAPFAAGVKMVMAAEGDGDAMGQEEARKYYENLVGKPRK